MKPQTSWSVRIVSLAAASVITALIVAVHDMDLADLGAREVIASLPVTIAAGAHTSVGDVHAPR